MKNTDKLLTKNILLERFIKSEGSKVYIIALLLTVIVIVFRTKLLALALIAIVVLGIHLVAILLLLSIKPKWFIE